ncbi:MAG: tRNA epoxyqueuosine(34) reductase QueG [Armatimonadetes bacterium]|nr:tRNA epoxyqueuosine(34) reductase QueG [Armatimonadota bacterium]
MLTAHVKAVARAVGFDQVGVAPAAEPARFAQFEAALLAGRHAEMSWLARPDTVAARRDPAQLLPGARSLICVAVHHRPTAPPAAGPRLAAYAQVQDYHDLLAPRLEALAAELRRLGGYARWCVDGGPVMEVAHAARAGLGWIGKHTLLLNREQGSWMHLAVVLTSLDLESDEPQPDRCGSCTRCLEACPTQAFAAPYVLDAGRCLSYLTIEHRGATPPKLREQAGPWAFGCDVCQAVCPWSRGAGLGSDAGLATGLAEELAGLDEAGFRQRYRGTPLTRPKRRGLLRNLCVALGNLGDRRAEPLLVRLLDDAEPLVRAHAAWALGRLGGGIGRAALSRALGTEEDAAVRLEIEAALGREDAAAAAGTA